MSSYLLICAIFALAISGGSPAIVSPQAGAIAAETSGPRFARKLPVVETQEVVAQQTAETRVAREEDQQGRGLLDGLGAGLGGLLMGVGGALAAQKMSKVSMPSWGFGGGSATASLVEDGDVVFNLYTKKNKKDPTIIKDTHKTPDSLEHWNVENPTIVLIHGWMETSANPINSAQKIKNAYMEENAKENIIVVDWGKHSSNFNYNSASKSSNQVATVVLEFLQGLIDRKFITDLANVHIIGFSLGAHIAGIVGKKLQKKNDGKKVGRITGLDPNWENYDVDTDEEKRLTEDDAAFVDVVHCNQGKKSGKFGTTLVIGTADFYPNGGVEQPSCQIAGMDATGICSTNKCYEMYAESINGKKYKACACASYEKFEENECDCSSSALMGENVEKTAKGKYYLHVK